MLEASPETHAQITRMCIKRKETPKQRSYFMSEIRNVMATMVSRCERFLSIQSRVAWMAAWIGGFGFERVPGFRVHGVCHRHLNESGADLYWEPRINRPIPAKSLTGVGKMS